METVTAWFWGPFSFWAVYSFLTNKPYRFVLQLIISLGKKLLKSLHDTIHPFPPYLEVVSRSISSTLWLQVSCTEQCFTFSRSTETVMLTASLDIQSTSGSTLCSWMCCGSSYRWRLLWTRGESCQLAKHRQTTQRRRRWRGNEQQQAERTVGLKGTDHRTEDNWWKRYSETDAWCWSHRPCSFQSFL